MRRYSLDQLTVLGVRPAELVEIAARAGYQEISPFVGLGDGFGMPAAKLRKGDPETTALAQALRDTGLRINNMDGFALVPDFDMNEAKAAISLTAELGARNIVALMFDPDSERSFEHLAELTGHAATVGLGIAIEFTAMSVLPSLKSALALLDRLDQPNAGLIVDTLHLSQAGETPADVAAIPAGRILGGQINDATAAPLSDEAYRYACISARLAPGAGVLPVAEFLRVLPDNVTIGLEAPWPEVEWNRLAGDLLTAAKRLEA